MTRGEPDTDAIGRHIARMIDPGAENEAFMRGLRAGIEACAASLDDQAARPASRTTRVRLSIALSKAAEMFRAAAVSQVPR